MSNFYFSRSIAVPFRMIFIMWMVFLFETLFSLELGIFGIIPRTTIGLVGIVSSPLLHGNMVHLVSNTVPLLFLGTTLFFFYDRIALRVFLTCYFLTGILVWIFARPSVHIGASGLIYGIASFLIFFGIFRKDIKSLLISIVITFLYGGLIYGVLPNQPGVSWESHLMGGIVGAVTAMNLSKLGRVSS
ncbi:MAG: rhomboid family intramembrane serine protease [Candidatus Cyclobacteriaceae bacterium M3_2C_046]